ncbi:MAG: hypothetical protein AABY95_05760 [Pseudomonadota bacterium]
MRIAILMSCLLWGLAACSREPEPEATSQQGREETRNIRATENIGYSGAAIANKVDGALNTADQRQQTLDAAAEPAQ